MNPPDVRLPAASKRPFGHPLPLEAPDYYRHPQAGHLFAQAAWGRDSKLYVSNGYVALRFFHFTAACGPGPQAVVDRLRRQAWPTGKHEDPAAWRKMDDCTLDLFREGIFPPWSLAGEALRYRVDPCVRVNHGVLVPAVSLQAISRLPRCEIYTTTDRTAPLTFRFKGGEGLVARLTEAQEARRSETLCHIFPRTNYY